MADDLSVCTTPISITFVFAFVQLAEGIGKVKVSIKKAKHDYYNYQPKDNMDYHGE